MRAGVARFRTHALAVVPVVLGCSDLGVNHPTAPDIAQVFSTPTAIEQTIGSGFQSCHNAVETFWGDGLIPQLAVMSLEGYGTVANFAIGRRVGIPRGSISNSLGSASFYSDYRELALGARMAANALTALDQLRQEGRSLGTTAQDLRARAFAFLTIGCHQGWLALAYDSAAVVRPGMVSDSIPPLSGYADVLAGARDMLDSAAAIASRSEADGSGGFPTPAEWAGGTQLSRLDFLRLVRSVRARFAAGVARTPAERAAVDWTRVLSDVESGITGDFMVNVGPAAGWVPGANVFGIGWFRDLSPFYYGMADVSGSYDAWLAAPLNQRGAFLIVTPDQRLPQGSTREAQVAASAGNPANFAARPYVSHRAGSPTPAHAWGESYYVHRRLLYFATTNVTGPFPSITKAEMDLLAAEAYLRLGNVPAAAAKIDITRVGRGGLPGLSGVITDMTEPVPGANDCVPRVPAPPAFTSTSCGTIWEAMKWEKRMETAFTGYGQWFFDSRGWGDLVENTALEFPVPFQEMMARQKVPYSLGGGLPSSAARGTYGF